MLTLVRSQRFVHILLIIVSVAAVYAVSLPYPFQYDDGSNITENPDIRSLGRMYSAGDLPDGRTEAPVLRQHYRVRALPYLSFWLNYKLAGIAETWKWRIVNVGLHALMACLVYSMVLLIFKMNAPGDPAGGRAAMTALASAVIYSVHPLATETVVYISGRVGQMAAVFYMVSVMAYLAWRTGGRRTWLWGSLVCGVLAMFSKETAFTLPLMLLMVEAMIGGGAKQGIGRLKWHMMLLPLIPLTKILVLAAGSANMAEALGQGSRLLSDTPRAHYLLTQSTVVARYLRLAFFPISQNLEYSWPLKTSLADPAVLLSLAALAAAAALGVVMYRRSGAHPELRVAALGIFGFFLALSVESTIFPIVIVIAEYRTYLPMAFLVPAAVVAASSLLDLMRINGRARIALAVVAVAALGGASVSRAQVWESHISLWQDVISKSPDNIRALTNLGAAYEETGDYDKALRAYQRVLDTIPDDGFLLNNVGSLYMKRGMWDAALDKFDEAARRKPDILKFSKFRVNRASAYAALGRYEEALADYQSVLSADPRNVAALGGAGNCMFMMEYYAGALRAFEFALELEPGNVSANVNAGLVLSRLDRVAEAEAHFASALSANRPPVSAFVTIIDFWRERGRNDKAREIISAGLAVYPDSELLLSRLYAL